MMTKLWMNSFLLEAESIGHLVTFTEAHLVFSPSSNFIWIISHKRGPYVLKFSFCQSSSMLGIFKVPPGVLISLIFTWLNSPILIIYPFRKIGSIVNYATQYCWGYLLNLGIVLWQKYKLVWQLFFPWYLLFFTFVC